MTNNKMQQRLADLYQEMSDLAKEAKDAGYRDTEAHLNFCSIQMRVALGVFAQEKEN